MTWRAVAKEDEIEEGKILGLAEGHTGRASIAVERR
jgi:hypothetical protein